MILRQELGIILTGFALMLKGYTGPRMSNFIFPTGITYALSASKQSISILSLATSVVSELRRKPLSCFTGQVWLVTSKLG
jgi:hypothetical protein